MTQYFFSLGKKEYAHVLIYREKFLSFASTVLIQKISDFLSQTRIKPRLSTQHYLACDILKNKIRCRLTRVAPRPYSRSPVLLLDTGQALLAKRTSQSVHRSAADNQPQHSTEVRQPRPTSFILYSLFSIIAAKDDVKPEDSGPPN